MHGGDEAPMLGGRRQGVAEVAGCTGETPPESACSTGTVEVCPMTCGAEDPLIMTFRVESREPCGKSSWDESKCATAMWAASCCTSAPKSVSKCAPPPFDATGMDFDGDDGRADSAMDSSLATDAAG
mmetsp:Transcript_79962/g.202321  ORF Transcript_79962/g.202321 Transcript_79962/m.202321 type:complete len:127 (+) Transcript_79962:246-626(+)